MSDFNSVARTWDENPVHLERSQAIASQMEKRLPLEKNWKALEYGAGTGILSFLLHEKVGHITLMDSASEMVKVMEEKVLQRGAANLTPVCFNLEQESWEDSYDLIFNQMVLHHIADVPAIFKQFYRLLQPGGYLAIADLYAEDGSFHGDGFDGHNGFDPAQLEKLLQEVGFEETRVEPCYTVVRTTPERETRSYPIFLLTGVK